MTKDTPNEPKDNQKVWDMLYAEYLKQASPNIIIYLDNIRQARLSVEDIASELSLLGAQCRVTIKTPYDEDRLLNEYNDGLDVRGVTDIAFEIMLDEKFFDFYRAYLRTGRIPEDKVLISMDKEHGIYRPNRPEKCYPITDTPNRGKRRKIVETLAKLKRGNTLTSVELAGKTGQTEKVIRDAIARINILFKERLEVAEDLITNINTGGYCLNRNAYDFELIS